MQTANQQRGVGYPSSLDVLGGAAVPLKGLPAAGSSETAGLPAAGQAAAAQGGARYGAAGSAGRGIVDYGAPGPYTVAIDKNVGASFRNTCVYDDTLQGEAFTAGSGRYKQRTALRYGSTTHAAASGSVPTFIARC